jgi:hypothetical protein
VVLFPISARMLGCLSQRSDLSPQSPCHSKVPQGLRSFSRRIPVLIVNFGE